MDIKEIAKTVSIPLISRRGKTLKFAILTSETKTKPRNNSPKSVTYSDLKEELIKVQKEIMELNNQTSGKGAMTSSFKGTTRRQTEKLSATTNSEVPAATRYNPKYNLVRPKLVGGCFGRSITASPRKQRIKIPHCINEELECTYPKKIGEALISETIQGKETEYEDLVKKAIKLNNNKESTYLKPRMPKIDFTKQTERKYIPLNLVHEGRFESKKEIFLKNSSPDFSKFSERKSKTLKQDLRYYEPKYEIVKTKITQDIDFSKFSQRTSLYINKDADMSRDLSVSPERIASAYEKVWPRNHISTPILSKTTARDDKMYRTNEGYYRNSESPIQKFLTLETYTK